MDKKACILGSGAWAGALAIILSDNGFDVTLWARNSHTREFFSEARMPVSYTHLDVYKRQTVTCAERVYYPNFYSPTEEKAST